MYHNTPLRWDFLWTPSALKIGVRYFRLQAEAKLCLKNLIDKECNYTTSERELLEIGLSDYNPFCPGNRDPRASERDRCAVSPEATTHPTHASTGPVTAGLPLAYTIMFSLFAYLTTCKWGSDRAKTSFRLRKNIPKGFWSDEPNSLWVVRTKLFRRMVYAPNRFFMLGTAGVLFSSNL